MSSLTKEEREKIIEEEKLRAEARAKYTPAKPQQVVVRQRSSGCLSLFILLIIIGVISSLVLNALGSAREKARQAQPQTASSSLPVIKTATFDVPALLDKSLAQAKSMLGTPDEAPAVPTKYEGKDWQISWEKDGNNLMISYDLKTQKIIDYFVSLGGTRSTSDTDYILKVGNLSKTDSRYKLEFVKCKNCSEPNQYLGVTVTPK